MVVVVVVGGGLWLCWPRVVVSMCFRQCVFVDTFVPRTRRSRVAPEVPSDGRRLQLRRAVVDRVEIILKFAYVSESPAWKRANGMTNREMSVVSTAPGRYREFLPGGPAGSIDSRCSCARHARESSPTLARLSFSGGGRVQQRRRFAGS